MADNPKTITKKRHWEWWVGILLGVAFSSGYIRTGDLLAVMGDLFLWLLIGLQIYTGLKIFRDHNFAAWPHKEKRRPNEKLFGPVAFYIGMTIFLMARIALGTLPAAQVGIKSGVDPVSCFAIGFLTNVIFQTAYGIAFPFFFRFPFLDSTNSNYRAFRMLLPRKRWKKYFFIVILILCNPIYEEVLYRGYLVHHLGMMIGNMALSAFLGYIIFLILHLYQGSSVVFIQTMNYLFFLGFLLSPWGLMAAIGFHFGGGLIPFLRMKRITERYRENVRKARKRSLERAPSPSRTLPETT